MSQFALPLLFVVGVSTIVTAVTGAEGDVKKASLSIKASPAIAFSPARVVLTADLKGGDDNPEDLYCPAVEWEWGDGTISNESADCEPFEAGKSEIKRRYVMDRVYRTSGDYRVALKLKRKDKVIATASTFVKIRPGVREGGGGQ